MGQRLFDLVVPVDRLHRSVANLRAFPGSEPTRLMLEEAFATFQDVDGNFVEQFQTSGFDARVFELYLHAYFQDVEFSVERPSQRPDFLITRERLTVAVEATTSNPNKSVAAGSAAPPHTEPTATEASIVEVHREVRHRPGRDDALSALSSEERAEHMIRHEHEFPIRVGSALYSKLAKRYWDLPAVAGKPFVLAVEAFHAEDSLYFSSSALADYLFGIQQTWTHDESGNLHVSNEPRSTHQLGPKAIPSHFFAQPGAEHVSAVLFTNSGTTAKFTRMGYQAGFHRGNLIVARSGFFIDPDPNSTTPLQRSYYLHDRPFYEEWGHGVVIFHNPNALRPVPKDFFPHATQVYMRGVDLVADGSLYSPYLSRTISVVFNDDTFMPVDLAPGGIGTLLEREFEQLGPMRSPVHNAVATEVSWFANRSRTVLGVVIQDNTDKDYNFVVPGRDERGRFRAVDVGDCYPAQTDAHARLIERLTAIDATGQTSFPQGDDDIVATR
jgi:hypothetical protein